VDTSLRPRSRSPNDGWQGAVKGGAGVRGAVGLATRHPLRRWVLLFLAVPSVLVFPALAVGTPPPATTWEHAWASGDAETLRSWFESNTGPTEPVVGTAPGGDVRTQRDADRLVGKVITSQLRVTCRCVLQQFVLRGADLDIVDGKVTVVNVTLDGQGTSDLVGAATVRGDAQVNLSHVRITGHHDGIRAYGDLVTGEYVYIHYVSVPNPQGFHEDGIQTLGGAASFTRSFVDMTGANTSAVLVKPDASPIRDVRITRSVIMGGTYTVHVHDGSYGAPSMVDLSNNIVAPGYQDGLFSTWDLTDPYSTVPPVYATVSGTGRRVLLVDGAII
jgi:hypothetical protein